MEKLILASLGFLVLMLFLHGRQERDGTTLSKGKRVAP